MWPCGTLVTNGLRMLEVCRLGNHDGGTMADYAVTMSDDEWRKELTPEQYDILRQHGTEPPGTGKYLYNKDSGMYRCAACGQDLFASDTKFESGTGWPSFTEPDTMQRIVLVDDDSLGYH